MTPKLQRWVLAVAIVTGLLTPSFAIAPKDDQTASRTQAAPHDQLLHQNLARKPIAPFAIPAQSTGDDSALLFVSVADGTVQVWNAPQPNAPQKLDVVAGIPDLIWCMIHFCKRWS